MSRKYYKAKTKSKDIIYEEDYESNENKKGS